MHCVLLTPINTITVSSQNNPFNAKFKTPQYNNSHIEMNVLHWRQILLHVKVQYIHQYVYVYESLKEFCLDDWLLKDFVP